MTTEQLEKETADRKRGQDKLEHVDYEQEEPTSVNEPSNDFINIWAPKLEGKANKKNPQHVCTNPYYLNIYVALHCHHKFALIVDFYNFVKEKAEEQHQRSILVKKLEQLQETAEEQLQ